MMMDSQQQQQQQQNEDEQDDNEPDWFVYRQGMSSDDIPWGVTHVTVQDDGTTTHIADQAFANFVLSHWDRSAAHGKFGNLRHVKLAPNSRVQHIGEFCFYQCARLVRIDFSPDHARWQTIGAQAFETCTSWTGRVKLPSSLTYVGPRAFRRCCSLSHVDFGNNQVLPELEAETFVQCSNLQEVILPNGLRRMGPMVFLGCTSLGSIRIPPSVEELGHNAWAGCTALALVEFASVGTLRAVVNEPSIFRGCTALQAITWPRDAIPLALWPRLVCRLFLVGGAGILAAGEDEEEDEEEDPLEINRISCLFSSLSCYQEELFGA